MKTISRRKYSCRLCDASNRANCQQLLRILFFHSKRLPRESLMGVGDESKPDIMAMCYNAAGDELFFAGFLTKMVRTIRLHDNAGDLRDRYRGTAEKPNHM